MIWGGFLVVVVLVFIFSLLLLGRDALATKVVETVLPAVIAGLGGYFGGRFHEKKKQDPPHSQPPM